MNDLKNAWLNIVKSCADISTGESVVIIVDTFGDHYELGLALFNVIQELGADPFLLILPERYIEDYHISFPRGIADMMKGVDVVFILTKQSFTHVRATTLARVYGCRVFSMPGINRDVLLRAGAVNYEQLRMECMKVRNFLNQYYGKMMVITTKLGTELYLKIDSLFSTQTGVYKKTEVEVRGEKWRFGTIQNIPAGEVWLTPNYINGVLIVDGSVTHLGKVDEPFAVHINEGKITSIEGKGRICKELKKMIEETPCLSIVAEFGIGINDKAIISGNVLEDEKVRGTIHIGIGDNINIRGRNVCDYHIDLVITKPTVEIIIDSSERVRIIEEGRFNEAVFKC